MDITSVAVFVMEGKVLLEKRRKDEDNYAGLWALPGGHKRKKESSMQALKREMREELRIHISKAEYIGTFRDIDPTSKHIYSHHAYLCTGWKDHIKGTTEEEKVKWIELKKIKRLKNMNPVDIKILKTAKLI